MNSRFDITLLSRVEDAGLNASAPPEQRWLDGWLLRFSPGKAKRSRCINAVAVGRMSVEAKLALAEAAYRDAQLPLVVRVTPFSQPERLDHLLDAAGMLRVDDTRVMVCTTLPPGPRPSPAGTRRIERVAHAAFAQTVGRLRGSPLAQWQAHAERLERAPVPFEGFVVKDDDGTPIACGQFSVEAEIAGLYDVFTAPAHRRRGLANALCLHMLGRAVERGARVACLQVESDNRAARSIYQRIGFADAYAYHYRTPAAASS